jgi:CheY-like chemotaxis protein
MASAFNLTTPRGEIAMTVKLPAKASPPGFKPRSDCGDTPELASRDERPRSVLIVEDQLMIADMTEACLVSNGYQVCGIARTVSEGVALGILHKPDLALIDLRLAEGGLGTEVAARLTSLPRLGVLYVTGNMAEVILTADHGHACLSKPYQMGALILALKIVDELVERNHTSLPFPRGFRILPQVTAL